MFEDQKETREDRMRKDAAEHQGDVAEGPIGQVSVVTIKTWAFTLREENCRKVLNRHVIGPGFAC